MKKREALKLTLMALKEFIEKFDSEQFTSICELDEAKEAIEAAEEALAQPEQEPKCNPHPKAPHGFNRNASHANDRYTCECESWDAYDAGYQAGVMAGIEASMGQEPEQEPIGEVVTAGVIRWKDKYPSLGTQLYTTPPQRKPLTSDELNNLLDEVGCSPYSVARAIEAAHGIKE